MKIIFKYTALKRVVLPRFANLLFIFFLQFYVTTGHALQLDEPTLKAAFVTRFLKYIEFPEALNVQKICFFGDGEVLHALKKYDGSVQGGSKISILEIDHSGGFSECNVVYVPGNQSNNWDSIYAKLVKKPILTIGEDDSFCKRQGMIQLKKMESSLIFIVNLKEIEKSGLKASSQLLQLAADVIS